MSKEKCLACGTELVVKALFTSTYTECPWCEGEKTRVKAEPTKLGEYRHYRGKDASLSVGGVKINPPGSVSINVSGTGHGSVNTGIRRFSSVAPSIGSTLTPPTPAVPPQAFVPGGALPTFPSVGKVIMPGISAFYNGTLAKYIVEDGYQAVMYFQGGDLIAGDGSKVSEVIPTSGIYQVAFYGGRLSVLLARP
jgi:hypothetical protein